MELELCLKKVSREHQWQGFQKSNEMLRHNNSETHEAEENKGVRASEPVCPFSGKHAYFLCTSKKIANIIVKLTTHQHQTHADLQTNQCHM